MTLSGLHRSHRRSTEASWDLEFSRELLIEESRNTTQSCNSTCAHALFHLWPVEQLRNWRRWHQILQRSREQLSLQQSLIIKGVSDWLSIIGSRTFPHLCVCWLIGLVWFFSLFKVTNYFHHGCDLTPNMTEVRVIEISKTCGLTIIPEMEQIKHVPDTERSNCGHFVIPGFITQPKPAGDNISTSLQQMTPTQADTKVCYEDETWARDKK